MAEPRNLFHAAHYNILAAQISEQLSVQLALADRKTKINGSAAITSVVLALARRFKEDNPRFDPIRFLDACSPDSEKYPLSELWEEE